MIACLCLLVALAEDREAAARAVLDAAKVSPAAKAETADLRVFATLPPAKVPALAAVAQKAHAEAMKALKKDDRDYWAGKLTVYAVTEARHTRAMLLLGLKQVGNRDTVRIDPRAEVPYVLVGVGPGEKRGDAQFAADVSAQVATAVLVKAAGDGADLPAWLRFGFGRVMSVRAEGAKAVAAQRAKFKALAARPDAKLSPADVWDGDGGPDADLRAMAFVDFLLSGTPGDKFGVFVNGFKPTDTVPMPDVGAALTAAGWKPEWLADGFKVWLAGGR
jgi:hypothetical protein